MVTKFSLGFRVCFMVAFLVELKYRIPQRDLKFVLATI